MSLLIVASLLFCSGSLGVVLWNWIVPTLFPRLVSDGYIAGKLPAMISYVVTFLSFVFWIAGKSLTGQLGDTRESKKHETL